MSGCFFMEKDSIEKTGFWCSLYTYGTKTPGGTVTTKTRTKPKTKKHVVDTSDAEFLRYDRLVAKGLRRVFAERSAADPLSDTRGLQYYPPEYMVLGDRPD